MFLLQGESNILIDAGVPGTGKKIAKKLRKRGVRTGELDLIIVTHAHYDHAGSANYLSNYFQASVLSGQMDEASLLLGQSKKPVIATPLRWLAKFALLGVKDNFDPITVVKTINHNEDFNLEEFGFKGTIRQVGGHTPGSLIVEMEDGNVFVSDLVRGSFFPLFKKRARVHLFMEDNSKAFTILEDILKRNPKKLYCGHGGPLSTDELKSFLIKRQEFYLKSNGI